MKKTTEIQPCTTNLCKICKQIYDKKNEGVNSLQISSPDGYTKKYCAKLDGLDDAVAKAEIVIEKKYTKYEAFLRLCNIYQDGMRSVATNENFEVGKLVSFIGISNIFK